MTDDTQTCPDLSSAAVVLAWVRKLHLAACEPLPDGSPSEPPTDLLLPAEAALVLLRCNPHHLDAVDRTVVGELEQGGTLLGLRVHMRACAKTIAVGKAHLPRLLLRNLGHPVGQAIASADAARAAAALCPALSLDS